ncbi:MAG: hypothetical protein UZ17_ACD001002792 [Acidobacteria bacterium OLB17]|nr:MAG: hypothetical protein UZ17_ACD001002792 [Acidobacteria bacterium OLB17]MCZ2391150.1 hypothetical protein [Acidobacteriota bacterium]
MKSIDSFLKPMVAVVVLLLPVLPGNAAAQEKFLDAPTVKLCELIQNPSPYQDKIIRIKATYRNQFEVSELFCSDCWNRDKGRIWVSFDESWEENTSRRIRKVLVYKDDAKTVNVTFVGKFFDPSPGDPRTGPYQFKFTLYRAEVAKVVYEWAPAPPNLPDDVKTQTSCGDGLVSNFLNYHCETQREATQR